MRPDRFGCEFEFIVETSQDQIVQEKLLEQFDNRFLVDLKKSSISSDPMQTKVHYKFEPSLNTEYGRELTSPVCSFDELREYLNIFSIIVNELGQTNELTGLHIHMSNSNESCIELDLCKFVLLANNGNLLNNWGKRNQYCLNLMHILDHLNFDDVILFKNHKGRVWNFLQRNIRHIEIRTFGGTNYQNRIEQVISEIEQYLTIFDEATSEQNSSEYLDLLDTHLSKVEGLSQETIENYLSTFPEIGNFLPH